MPEDDAHADEVVPIIGVRRSDIPDTWLNMQTAGDTVAVDYETWGFPQLWPGCDLSHLEPKDRGVKCPKCGVTKPFNSIWHNYSNKPGSRTVYICPECPKDDDDGKDTFKDH